MEIIYLLAGLLMGAGGTFLAIRNNSRTGERMYKDKLDLMQKSLDELKKQHEDKDAKLMEISRNFSYQNAENKHLQEKLKEQKEELLKLHDRLNIEFKNLANEILEEKSKKFTEQNKANIDMILKPLSEKIKEFEKKVEETYDKESKQRFSLKEEVKKLAELNQKVSEEAGNLTRALKGETKTQGNWGEMILESILDKSGLVKDREYFVQKTFRDEAGNMLRPDVIVEYPGQRYVVIDSKVSLTAYEKYVSAEEESIRTKALTDHLISVKNHITGLGRKNYHEVYDVKSLDFIMLFMPVEPAYLLAIQNDPELWNFAYDKRILLISPTNLIAALKMISSLWKQEHQNRNAREIARKSGDLLDKFYGLLADLEDVGRKMQLTQKAYDSTISKLSTGRGNLIKRTEDIRKLGAQTGKSIPREFEEKVEDEE